MRSLLFILLLFGEVYTQTPGEWWAEADSLQRISVRGSYDRNKGHDKGFTLAAFNPIESAGGRYLLRLGEDTAGEYSQKGYNVAKRENKQKRLQVPFDSLWIYPFKKIDTPTKWEISRAVQRLVQDREFDDRHARAHIDELLDRYGDDWMKVWQAWNGHKKGQAEEVRAWVRFLKRKFK